MASTVQTVTVGAELSVNGVGLGTTSLTGAGVWGEPRDPRDCTTRHACEASLDPQRVVRQIAALVQR